MKMVIVGTGIDIIEVERIRKACINPRFPKKVFTDREWEHIESRGKNMQTVAGNFAAKEAVAKALGTGFGKVGWKDIQIFRKPDGRPYVELSGQALFYMSKLGGKRVWISISHIKELAVAQAVIEG
ncbi:MAG: holo-ACP synthase [Clostridiales bacterium]|nr:holo-ACP synthase [Clostridiales bacterium]